MSVRIHVCNNPAACRRTSVVWESARNPTPARCAGGRVLVSVPTAATGSPPASIFSPENAVCTDSYRRQCREWPENRIAPTLTSVRILTDSVLHRENKRAWAIGVTAGAFPRGQAQRVLSRSAASVHGHQVGACGGRTGTGDANAMKLECREGGMSPPELKVSTPAHTKHLCAIGRCLEFEFRVGAQGSSRSISWTTLSTTQTWCSRRAAGPTTVNLLAGGGGSSGGGGGSIGSGGGSIGSGSSGAAAAGGGECSSGDGGGGCSSGGGRAQQQQQPQSIGSIVPLACIRCQSSSR